jgi:hypothetical protein
MGVIVPRARNRHECGARPAGRPDIAWVAMDGLLLNDELVLLAYDDEGVNRLGRLAEIGAGDWASAATKKAIEETQAAVLVATTAAATAAIVTTAVS